MLNLDVEKSVSSDVAKEVGKKSFKWVMSKNILEKYVEPVKNLGQDKSTLESREGFDKRICMSPSPRWMIYEAWGLIWCPSSTWKLLISHFLQI